MTEAEGYIERKNLKSLSEKDNDQLGTIIKEAYISGMNTSQRAIFDHVDTTLSTITKIAKSLGVSTRKMFDLYLEVGKKGFLCKKVARQLSSLGFPVHSEISINTNTPVAEVDQAIIDEKISVLMVEKAFASFLEKGAGRNHHVITAVTFTITNMAAVPLAVPSYESLKVVNQTMIF